jgi:hypothetical protein
VNAQTPKSSLLSLNLGEYQMPPEVLENTEIGQAHKQERYKLKGRPLAGYIDLPIDPLTILLGNRYLCQGGGMFIVAPSGIGKSVLSIQMAIQWSVGKSAFGIKPARALRVLIIQAEDDDGDIKEMSQIAKHLQLDQVQMGAFQGNVWMESLNHLSAGSFIDALDSCLDQFPADLVIVNPYTSYLGADIKEDGKNNEFLRNRLNPILTKHKCAAVIIHHTPKTTFQDTTDWKPSDWMYRGAGAACLTNWARAILVIDPTKVYGCYRFIAAKRGKRIGWADPNTASPMYEMHYSHSNGDKLLWVPSTADEIGAASIKKGQLSEDPEDLLRFVPAFGLEPQSEKAISTAAQGFIKQKKITEMLAELVAADEITRTEHPRKGTRPEIKYVRSR